MKRSLAVLLGLSIAGNAIQALLMVSRMPVTSKSATDQPTAVSAPVFSVPEWKAPPNLAEKVAALRDRKVPEDEIRLVAAGTLRVGLQPVQARDANYWSRAWEGRLQDGLLQSQGAREAAMKELVMLFGESAEQLPEFAEFFRPLGHMYPFLSSSEQRAVAARRAQRQLANAARVRELQQPDSGRGPPNLAATPRAEPDDYSDLLSEEHVLEVALRDSVLATQLRTSGVTFTESGYRALFIAIWRAERDGGALRLEDLSRTVPFESAIAALASRDPGLAALRDVAEAHGVGTVQVAAAFDVYTEARLRINQQLAARQGHLDPQGATTVHEILADRDRQIAATLGQEVANAVVRRIQAGMIARDPRQVSGSPLVR